MGTKAVFAIGLENGTKYGTTIIGMTNDGGPENLRYLAECARFYKKKLGIDKVDTSNYVSILDRVVEHINKYNPDWLFLDKYKNAQWLSYSAIADLENSKVEIFGGCLDEELLYCNDICAVLVGD